MKSTTRLMKYEQEVVNHAIDQLNDGTGVGVYGCDLHNDLFNTGYFIIGTWRAEQWLTNGPGVFQAIEDIKEYEQMQFGEVSTDFSSSEKVVNMWVYIKGEEVLALSGTLQKYWDKKLTESAIKRIAAELERYS